MLVYDIAEMLILIYNIYYSTAYKIKTICAAVLYSFSMCLEITFKWYRYSIHILYIGILGWPIIYGISNRSTIKLPWNLHWTLKESVEKCFQKKLSQREDNQKFDVYNKLCFDLMLIWVTRVYYFKIYNVYGNCVEKS